MSDRRSLKCMFVRCLNAEYIHTHRGGDYAIENEPPYLYLLFEKSDGREDWLHNLNFAVQKVNPQDSKKEQWYSHKGFLKIWNAMRSEVMEKISELIHKGNLKYIICVGYSHGAALSLLATEAISKAYEKDCHVEGYGFGSPRVVWGHLPNSVEKHLKNYHTIRNIPDAVTHLPPAMFGFKHVHLESIGKTGKYGPIMAHTSQAYIHVLSKNQEEGFMSVPSILSIPHIPRVQE